MRLGLCAELSRLWIRLVIKTVLPERLRPVTASQTVAPPASSPRLSRSDAWAKIGGSQLKFTMDGITKSDRSVSPAVVPAKAGSKTTGLWNMGSQHKRVHARP